VSLQIFSAFLGKIFALEFNDLFFFAILATETFLQELRLAELFTKFQTLCVFFLLGVIDGGRKNIDVEIEEEVFGFSFSLF
jgi:hypothetical protein